MPGLAHEPERLPGPPHIPAPHRQRLQVSGLQQRDQEPEDLPEPVRSRLAGHERLVGHAGVIRGDPGGVADVGLAQVKERPAPRQQPQRGVGQLPGQRVQHDVHPRPVRGGQEFRLEPRIPGRGDVRLVQAHGGQHRVLACRGGGVDLQAQIAGDGHRGHPRPAGRRVHQQPLPGPRPGQVDQRVPCRGERHRHRRRPGERPASRNPGQHRRIGHCHWPEPAGGQAQHPVPGRQPAHPRAGLGHHPGDLAADYPAAGVHAQPDQHVPEVQPGRPDRHPHLPRAQRPGRRRARHQRQSVQRARPGGLQPPRHPPARPGQPARRTRQPPPEHLPVPDRQLRLPRPQRRRQHPGGIRAVSRTRRGQVGQDQPARVLRLRRPDQPPHRRAGQIGHALPRPCRHRPPRHHHQPRRPQPTLGQPLLHQPQHPPRRRPRRLARHHPPSPAAAPAQASTTSGTGSPAATAAASRPDPGTPAHPLRPLPALAPVPAPAPADQGRPPPSGPAPDQAWPPEPTPR